MNHFIKKIVDRLWAGQKDKPPVVSWDEQQIVYSGPGGETRYMPWSHLCAVVIETTDEGPWAEDVYFLLFSEALENSFGFPQCAQDSQALLERLMQLPGFNSQAVVAAMGSTANKSFLCWEKPGWAGQHWPGIQAARQA